MERTTRKKLLQVAAYCRAKDITSSEFKVTEYVERVMYSDGINGVSSLLLKGVNTNNYYVITTRSSNLFRYLA